MGFAGALNGNAFAKIVDPLLIFVESFVLLGVEPAGRETIYGDAVLAPVVGEAHGELAIAAATGAIGSESGVTGDAGDGSDVDDAAVFGVDHAAGNGLGHKKTAAQIGVENYIPIFPGDFERRFADVEAGVVYKNIEMGNGGLSGADHGFEAVLIAKGEFETDPARAEQRDCGVERERTRA